MHIPSIQLLRSLRASEAVRTSAQAGKHLNKPHIRRFHISSRAITILSQPTISRRSFSTIFPLKKAASPPTRSKDRGPTSDEKTQTDFGTLNVLGNSPPPTTAINACLSDGFHFDNGMKIGGGSGCLLVAGEAFSWRPWEAGGAVGNRKMINGKGQWEVGREAWGLLELVWPKPDMLILGLGPSMHPISPETRKHLSSLGVRVELQDTRNAAAQFNLLATERGVGNVAAALIPIGWKESK
ncbi:MAG: hypothetical protein MMC33_000154 [Icmadophila ericetorum]|nr:hypothetical protein [Icmadophila ericetorum]